MRIETIFGGLPFRRSLTPCVSPLHASVISFAHYFQVPATQASFTDIARRSHSSFFSTCLKGLPCDFLPHTTQPFFDLSLLSLTFKIQNKTYAKKTTNRPAYTASLHLIVFVLVLLKKSGKRTCARHVRAHVSGYL